MGTEVAREAAPAEPQADAVAARQPAGAMPARSTNCIHAALVELKAGGVAADYWMKGEATVPLSVLPAASAPSSSGGWF